MALSTPFGPLSLQRSGGPATSIATPLCNNILASVDEGPWPQREISSPAGVWSTRSDGKSSWKLALHLSLQTGHQRCARNTQRRGGGGVEAQANWRFLRRMRSITCYREGRTDDLQEEPTAPRRASPAGHVSERPSRSCEGLRLGCRRSYRPEGLGATRPRHGLCRPLSSAPMSPSEPAESVGCHPEAEAPMHVRGTSLAITRGLCARAHGCAVTLRQPTTSEAWDGLISHCGVSFPAGSESV